MPYYYAILWIPYLLLLYSLSQKPDRRIYGICIIIIAGLTRYRLPVTASNEFYLYHAGLLFYLLLQVSTKQSLPKGDMRIWKATLIFYIIFVLSSTFGIEAHYQYWYSYVYRVINYSLLLLITVRWIRTENDIHALIKGMLLGVFIVEVIGLGQFFTGNPHWGLQPGQKYVATLTGYGTTASYYGREWRVFSTVSNCNAFGTLIAMILPIIVREIIINRKSIIKLVFIFVLMTSLVAIIISGARTAILSAIIVLPIFIIFLGVSHLKRKKFILITIFTIIISLLTIQYLRSDYYFSTIFSTRLQSISSLNKTIEEFQGTRLYKWTRSWEGNFHPMLFIIGYGVVNLGGTNQPHNNYLAIFFLTGFWGFAAFFYIVFRAIRISFDMQDKLLQYTLVSVLLTWLLTSLAYENTVHTGQPLIFWPTIAILASKVRFQISTGLSEKRVST